MATRFEIALHGGNPVSLRAAAEEALDEIERIESQLSLYRPTTEIARVNALAHREPVRVSLPVFRLLQRARQLHQETDGVFDITIAPLLRCWGLMGGAGRVPTEAEIAEARACVGMGLVQLDDENLTVRFQRPGVMLDLGAIGKGYAVEKAAELLRELGVTSALIHGGTSTIYALGQPPDQETWKVALEMPSRERTGFQLAQPSPGSDASQVSREARPTPLAVVPLRDESLSVSAVWGKSFHAGGKTYGHIIDPRTGTPADAAILAAVVLPSATETDALSTALMTLGCQGHSQIAALRPGMKSFLASRRDSDIAFEGRGIAPLISSLRHPEPPARFCGGQESR
ncbi:MAG: FAD:protein FMN transferase [Verrucomicrobia bacterium]|nr:FAD:protein FMN transferase [Verrucomicrobiota bacterium]